MSMVSGREFACFCLAGLTAAAANLGAVWIARNFFALERAVFCGILAGILISFILSKFVVFNAGKSEQTGRELALFIAIYGFGSTVYWTVAVTGAGVLTRWLGRWDAEVAATILGAGCMMVTSYLGHKLFTFATGAKQA